MEITIDILRALLMKNNTAKIRIISDSMAPLIKPGEVVNINSVHKELSRFDIIVFDYYGAIFCHFFWKKLINQTNSSISIQTRSLKKPAQADIPISPQSVIGVISCKKLTLFHKIKIYFNLAINPYGN